MNFREDVVALIAAVVETQHQEMGAAQVAKLIETPKDSQHGDWAFPCFALAKQLRFAPPQIAADLAASCEAQRASFPNITSVAALGPYVNFTVSRSNLAAQLLPAILSGEFLRSEPATNERVVVEYSQPNTHKAFHVGHCRCASLGDSVIRLLEFCGVNVVAANYLGDEGTHVARCLWFYRNHFHGVPPTENRGEFLGELYTKATEMLDLGTLTRAPMPGVRAAQVVAVRPPPGKQKWQVVELNTVLGAKTVVCGATGFAPGDLVPYAACGVRVNDKEVALVERDGVVSDGMILSSRELGISDDHSVVPVLPTQAKIGDQVADLYIIPEAFTGTGSVLDEIARRGAEVSKVLQAMEAKEPQIHSLWAETKEWSMEEYYKIYAWLNCRFDHYFFESEFGEEGKRLTREFQAKGVFVESEGAIGADLRDADLGFAILIKRDGTATYATRDLALARRKFDQYHADRSIYIVDAGQTLHFAQVFRCLQLMGYQQWQRCKHLGYAQVVRPDGKMSSRKGNVILFSALTKRLIGKVRTEFLDSYKGDWSEQEIAETAYRIALATVRYGMLNQDNNTQIVFDLDNWTAKTGNTGPYVMYANARIRSILRDALGQDFGTIDWTLLNHATEGELLVHLSTYRETLSSAAENFAPNQVCSYVYELAKSFSRWYQSCSILNAENVATRNARLALGAAIGAVLEHGLGILGIKPVERM